MTQGLHGRKSKPLRYKTPRAPAADRRKASGSSKQISPAARKPKPRKKVWKKISKQVWKKRRVSHPGKKRIKLHRSRRPQPPTSVQAEQAQEKGIQLIGFNRRETGIGESCRLAAEAIQTTGIPYGILHYSDFNIDRDTDLTWVHKEMPAPRYKVNIFHMNADTLQEAARHFGEGLFRNRYNIGYWHWELPEFPEEWCSSFSLVQEVWVPSLFVMDSISRKSPVPVIRIPHGIQVQVQPHLKSRAYFGLPEGRFLFLSMFDARSVVDRKNPQAAIEAFKRAFPANDPSVGLVIKMNNPYPAAVDLVRQLTEGYGNVYLMARAMERQEANALISVSDSVVSLHRAEGYGLTLAEGMYLGKPAIGTNWSGNTDFMNPMNACPVDYRLVPVGADYGPYRSQQIWADPDIDHAAHYMRRLVQDSGYRQLIAARGQETIMTQFSPAAAGEMIRQRLGRLGLV